MIHYGIDQFIMQIPFINQMLLSVPQVQHFAKLLIWSVHGSLKQSLNGLAHDDPIAV